MKSAELCEALRSGKRVYGTLIVSSSPEWPQHVKHLDLDFVFIDTEHVAIGRETLAWICQAYQSLEITPLVRIPTSDPYLASIALDAGAGGIIAPYVEKPEQVQKLRGAIKYRPIKGVKSRDILDGKVDALEPELASYLNTRNQAAMLVNIESVAAIRALDEILCVPGLDAVLIGPHDLSCSMGIPEAYDHPDFDHAVRTILKKARDAGVGAGIHYSGDDIDQEISWIKEGGANLIIHSADIISFIKCMREDIHKIKGALGDDIIPTSADNLFI